MTTKAESKLLKEAATMSTGKTATKLEAGATIDLHGHPTRITHTDDKDTTVQYPNLARRTFDTHTLNSFLELGTFPVDTAFERPTAYRNERAIIEAVTGDCCYQVRIIAGGEMPRHETMTYADFIAWHMNNNAGDAQNMSAKDRAFIEKVANEAADTEPDNSNPFEADLKNEIARLQKELELAEANGQSQINKLLRERSELAANIATLKANHATIIAGYEQDIARLEAKAAILNPEPVRKEVCTLVQMVHMPEMRKAADIDLASKLSDGWTALNIHISTEFGTEGDCYTRIITLVRDLPAAPAPKVVEVDAAVYSGLRIGAVPLTQRPPVQHPPMPANQTIVPQMSASRPLTHNVSRITGETKRIPTLAELQERREKDNAEIEAIMQRGLAEQEVLRRKFAQSPSPFNMTGAQ